MFRMMVSVSGVGNNTALLMLSSLQPDDLSSAILNGNVSLLKAVKGIGEKTAQRIVLELRDRMGGRKKSALPGMLQHDLSPADEAAEALVALGFARAAIDKALTRVARENGNALRVDDCINHSLQII